MAIDIQIGPSSDEPVVANPNKHTLEKPTHIKMKLQIRKNLEGELIISDHPDIFIVVQPDKMKIVAFPKETMTDDIYGIQDKLFKFLQKNGIIEWDSVKGGNVYGALEATIGSPTTPMSVDEISVFAVGKFIEQERPAFSYQKSTEKKEEDRLLNPDTEDSTELGEIPHAEEKGSIMSKQVRKYISGF